MLGALLCQNIFLVFCSAERSIPSYTHHIILIILVCLLFIVAYLCIIATYFEKLSENDVPSDYGKHVVRLY